MTAREIELRTENARKRVVMSRLQQPGPDRIAGTVAVLILVSGAMAAVVAGYWVWRAVVS